MANSSHPPPAPRPAPGCAGKTTALLPVVAWLGVCLAASATVVLLVYQIRMYELTAAACAEQDRQAAAALSAADNEANRRAAESLKAAPDRALQKRLAAEVQHLQSAVQPLREQVAKVMAERDAGHVARADDTVAGADLDKLKAEVDQLTKTRDELRQRVADLQTDTTAKPPATGAPPAGGNHGGQRPPPIGTTIIPDAPPVAEAPPKPDPADFHINVTPTKITKQGNGISTDRLHFTVAVRNSSKREYKNLKLVVMAYGDAVGQRERYMVIGKDLEDFDLPGNGQHTFETREMVNTYGGATDTSNSFGSKYAGYFVFVVGPDDKLISFESRASYFQKLGPQLLKLGDGDGFDRDARIRASDKPAGVVTH